MTERAQPAATAMAWIAIVLVGAILRLVQTLSTNVPLGDGGLFHSAIDAMRAAGGLPATIPYNGEIPFVYPPLGFVVGAVLTLVPGLDTDAVLRFLPPILAITALGLMPWAVGRFSGSDRVGLIAASFVAVMPQAYDQLIAGGGITRGLGVVLSLAAIGVASGPTPGVRRAGLTGLLLGLTALSHPRVAIFAVLTVAVVWWLRRASVSRRELAIGGVVLAATVLPWLALLAGRGQIDALLSGGQRFDPVSGFVGLFAYPAMEAMHGGIPNVAVALSIAGVVASLLLGRFALPLWLLLVHVVGSPIFVSPIAWAIVGAAGIGLVLDRLAGPGQPWRASRSFVAGAAVIVLVAVMSASASPADPGSKQQPIGADQRTAAIAMRSLPADARIAVVTSETWGNDLVGEWLPTLSGRTVVTTPQGAEWLGRAAFDERRAMHDAARACHRSTSHCLADALARGQLDATHVVIPRGSVGGPRAPSECCPALLETIRTDPRFDVVYDEAGALVAAWRP